MIGKRRVGTAIITGLRNRSLRGVLENTVKLSLHARVVNQPRGSASARAASLRIRVAACHPSSNQL